MNGNQDMIKTSSDDNLLLKSTSSGGWGGTGRHPPFLIFALLVLIRPHYTI